MINEKQPHTNTIQELSLDKNTRKSTEKRVYDDLFGASVANRSYALVTSFSTP